ncbi:MAG: ferritin-like domain-containing protein [Bacteroidetes bacterium]|nr:ferritin-like domain-containing protein [Bacteroidota bacterium]
MASTKQTKGQNIEEQYETTDDLMELFINELKDILWAEKALTKALPKMAKNACSEALAEALENHLEETEGQIERLEQIFEILDVKAQAKKCEAMDGLIREGNELMQMFDCGVIRDAAIISAGQKIEHYEIATYGTLRAFAEILELDEVAELLEETLEEEKAADEKLTEVTTEAVAFEDEEGDNENDEEEESEEGEEEEGEEEDK